MEVIVYHHLLQKRTVSIAFLTAHADLAWATPAHYLDVVHSITCATITLNVVSAFWK
jgi:hypothetical protein